MLLAYFDESGDAGYVRSPTQAFTLACLLVRASDWDPLLHQLVLLRRSLKTSYGIKMSDELKAQYFVHGKGPFAGQKQYGDNVRLELFRRMLRFTASCGLVKAMAVCIRKDKIAKPSANDPRELAWRFMLQRVERETTKAQIEAVLFPDSGHHDFLRRKVRAQRRVNYVKGFYGGMRALPATKIVEDPNDRHSHQSYFIQMADFVAYAAYRKVFPHKLYDATLWNELGSARHADANRVAGGPPGLVEWPK